MTSTLGRKCEMKRKEICATRKNCQMSITVAQKWFHRKMIYFDTFTKLLKNVGDLGKLIVAKGFKNLPKVQQISQSGHTEGDWIFTWVKQICVCVREWVREREKKLVKYWEKDRIKNQCDQMARLFVQYWVICLKIRKFPPKVLNICPSRLKILPSTKWTL